MEEIEGVVKCINLGAEDYLPKPVDPTLLRARLGTCLEKKRLRDNEVIYLKQIEAEKKYIDELLQTTLPPAAIQEIKERGHVARRRFENVVVLFCDVIGFTKFCDKESPENVVKNVTNFVECFENIVLKYGMEKIKTIGDEFMATANLLEPIDNPLMYSN